VRPRHGVDLAALARQVQDGWAGAGFTSTQDDVWVGRPDGVPVPDITGIEAAVPPVDRRPWLPRTAGTIARRANGHGVSATPQNVSRCRHDRFAQPGPLPVGEGDRERATRDFHRKDLR
jgi:membrane carboxypeptidase/penicillin-binding protein PbpC